MGSAWTMMYNYSKAQSDKKKVEEQLKVMPQYEIPKEYDYILKMAKQQAGGEMPGYAQSKMDIGQAGAEANYALGQTAISSNVAQAGAQDVLAKQLQAYQNLNTMSAQWKDAQQEKLKGAYEMTAQQKVEQWIQNQLRPWEIKTNMYREDQLGALSTARSSTPQDEDIMSSIMGFAGMGG
jgi:hypothetical protein